MLVALLLASIFSCALLIFLTNSPIVVGLLLLLFATTTMGLLSILIQSWFTFIVFIVYVGGLLVIIAYFLALVPKQRHAFSPKTNYIKFLVPLALLLFNLTPPTHIYTIIFHKPFIENITSFYLPSNLCTLIFIALLLFVTIVSVVKIVRRSAGPLRPYKTP